MVLKLFSLRIGVNGFENPMRDPKIDEFKKHIGSGCKLKMDDRCVRAINYSNKISPFKSVYFPVATF